MGKNERRAAKYQEDQRRKARQIKEAKAAADRAAEDPGWGQYQLGGLLPPGTITFAPGSWSTLPSRAEIGPPKVDLPVSESTELIVGYRMWPLSLSYPAGYRLTAMNVAFDGTVYPNQRLEAVCKANGNGGMWGWSNTGAGWYQYVGAVRPEPKAAETHQAPHQGCGCGIHAYKTSVPLEHGDKPYVAGEVYLWGKVIVHETGYRAQFAYPKRLVVIDGGARASKIADELELAYGVPCTAWA